jgi:hypothetical protein
MMCRRLILCILLAAILPVARGQNVRDAGLWISGSAKADIGKKLEAHVAPEVRLDENITRVRGFFSDIGISRGISDYLTLHADLRVGARRMETWYEGRQRLSLGASLRIRKGDFSGIFLARKQFTPDLITGEGDVDVRRVTRLRTTLKYGGIKKTDASLSVELFYGTFVEGMSNWRAQAGLERKLSKRNFVELTYMIQKDLSNQDMDFVIRLGYTRKMDLDKRKSKADAPPLPG